MTDAEAVKELVEAEQLARRFHETYENLAPLYGYETRKASAVPWVDVPENNRRLMIAVCGRLLPHIAELESQLAAHTAILTEYSNGHTPSCTVTLWWAKCSQGPIPTDLIDAKPPCDCGWAAKRGARAMSEERRQLWIACADCKRLVRRDRRCECGSLSKVYRGDRRSGLLFDATPIFESDLVPAAQTITRRVDWITREVVDGKLRFHFRHDLRHQGSVYETHQTPRMMFAFNLGYLGMGGGMAIVAHPEDAVKIRSVT